jgi:hypothetical protein
MRVDTSGNLGIGTSSPSTYGKFAVVGSGFNGGNANFVSTSSGNSITVTGVNGAGVNDVAYYNFTDGTNNAFIGLTGTNATAGALRFATGTSPTERMRIDSSGNVGIGTSSGTRKLNVYGGASGTRTMTVTSNASEGLEVGVNASNIAAVNSAAGGAIIFTQADTERMRIDSSGNLLVGTTGTANGKVHISGSVVYTVPATFSASIGANAAWTTGYGSQAINLSLWASSGIGGVSVYNVSDRRLKEQISPLTGLQALSFIEKAKPVQFVWKEEQTTDTGFIAQDILAAGFGHLVSAIPDNAVHEETDENGNVSPAGSRFVMKYDSVIPILTAAIQEQQALITQLTNRITALESK